MSPRGAGGALRSYATYRTLPGMLSMIPFVLLPLLACEEEVEPIPPIGDCLPDESGRGICACSADADCDEAAGEQCNWGECLVACDTHEACRPAEVCCRRVGPVKSCGTPDDCNPPYCADEGEATAPDRSCQPRCSADAECPGEVCCTDGPTPVCLPDEACASDCAPSPVELARACCASIADCYDLGAICTVDSRCTLPSSCPALLAATPGDPGAPVLFYPAQLELAPGASRCVVAPQHCPDGGQRCAFDVYFFDPDGDAPQTREALLAQARLVRSDGSEAAVADAAEPDIANSRYELQLCFGAEETTLAFGLRVADDAGHRSAVLCVEGSAP